MKTLHLSVRGVVQGVGFRWFVRELARRWGLRGWVRNREDGSVEVLLSGSEQGVDALAEAVRTGPPGAKVSEVVELPEEESGGELPHPFTVIR